MPSQFPALAVFAFAAVVTPGPNNIMLMTSGLNFGFRRTVPHLLGIVLGFTILILAIGLGLAGMIARVPVLLTVLRWAGAAYLLVLAIKIAGAAAPEAGAARGKPLTFVQAIAFQWVNPKAWLGALTGCATFSVSDDYVPSIILIAVTMASVNLPCAALWTGFGTQLQGWLGRPGRLAAFNWTMAALLIASLYPILRG